MTAVALVLLAGLLEGTEFDDREDPRPPLVVEGATFGDHGPTASAGQDVERDASHPCRVLGVSPPLPEDHRNQEVDFLAGQSGARILTDLLVQRLRDRLAAFDLD